MDFSLGNIIAIGLRIINNRDEVARVARKAIAQINQAEELWVEVRSLIEKIAPELLTDLHVTPQVRVTPQGPPTYDVKWVQQALNHLMHPRKINVDGVMGRDTRSMIGEYQAKRGLTVDGWLGPITLAALDADVRAAHAGTSR